MKISSSSSLLFATLAISSSSSSLAAPTGDTSQAETGFPNSSSNHHIASRRGSFNMARSDAKSTRTSVQKRDIIGAIICPVEGLVPLVGSILNPLLGNPCSSQSAASAEAVEGLATNESSSSSASDEPAQGASSTPTLPAQPPNTPKSSAADTMPSSSPSPSSPPSQRRDVPTSLRGHSLPLRAVSADAVKKTSDSASSTSPTTEPSKAGADPAEGHSAGSSAGVPTAETVETPVNPPADLPVSPLEAPVKPSEAPVSPPAGLPVNHSALSGQVPVQEPLGGKVPNVPNAPVGTPGPEPSKRFSAHEANVPSRTD
ncbi:hypothetical protein DFS33DRAFT_1272172 [Desarmillaria ectypa]|nr:hypothetical protein DFS33DRAFT_1272172 [Desarmillaria ectypa]